jgi:hypothetical protein
MKLSHLYTNRSTVFTYLPANSTPEDRLYNTISEFIRIIWANRLRNFVDTMDLGTFVYCTLNKITMAIAFY